MGFNIVTIGDLNWDVILRTPRIPNADEEIALDAVTEVSGGDAANVATACARLGASVSIVGAVGGDLAGREVLRNLNSLRVNTKRVYIVTENTGRAYSLVEPSGERRLLYFRGANGVRRLEEEDLAQLKNAEWVYIADPLPSTVQTLEKWYRQGKLGTPLALDPGAVGASRGFTFFAGIAPYLRVLLLNEIEMEIITQIRDIDEAAQRLLELAPLVVIKRGKKGSFVITRKEAFLVPAFSVEASDTTGCGDAFNGAFLLKLTESDSLQEAARWGNAAGAIVAQRVGAGQSDLTKDNLKEFLEANRN